LALPTDALAKPLQQGGLSVAATLFMLTYFT